jgi:chromatin remodeling complex protein RSC6
MNSFKNTINDRLSHPLLSSFFIAWVIINWRVPITIFSNTGGYTDKIFYISSINICWWTPILIALGWVFAWPYLNFWIISFHENKNTKIKNEIKKHRDKVLLSEDETFHLRNEIQKVKDNYRTLKIKERAEYNELLESYNSAISVLESKQVGHLIEDDEKHAEENETPAFMQPLIPSSALAAIVGKDPLSRTEVVKRLWQYIKKHDLQDKKDRRSINPDKTLGEVLGSDQISMFEMTKVVSKHLKPTKTENES